MRAIFNAAIFGFSFLFVCAACAASPAGGKREFEVINRLIFKKEYQRAYPLLLDSARKGNGLSHFLLGLYYKNGWGVPIQMEKSCHWFKRAAAKGIPAAQGFWADCMINSPNVNSKSAGDAIAMYIKSAENGYFIGWCQAADFYINGLWVDKDIRKGLDLCAMAADRGVPAAMHKYGNYLHEVENPYRNLAKAKEWLYKASLLQIPEAKFDLGNLLAKGDADEINLLDAIYLMESSATDGYAPAYLRAAIFYYNKTLYYKNIFNDQEDLRGIYKWLNIAVEVDPNVRGGNEYKILADFIDGKIDEYQKLKLQEIVKEHLDKFGSKR